MGNYRLNPLVVLDSNSVEVYDALLDDPGGGVTSIYTGTGRAIFWGAFFRAGNKFWGIIFGKIIGGHKFWGIIFSITNYGPIIRYLFPT